jgi:AraC-like DNA-binding protein
MEIFLEYNLDYGPESRWNTVSATAASKASLLYLQEAGEFFAGPEYYTTREGFASYLLKYTISGCGVLEYQGQQHLVPPGHVYWIDCRKRQHYHVHQSAGHWRVIWVHFYGANAQFYYDLFLKQNGGSPVAAMPVDSPVYKILHQLLEQSGIGGYQQKNDLIYANLLHQLVNEVTLSTMVSDHLDDIPQTIRSVQIYLTQNYQKSTTLEQLGSQFNLNPFYLQKQFKRYVGQTPSEYVIYLRITRAKELLRNTQKPIGEIAADVGIDNLGYFTRLFKKQEGMTPRDYSKLWPTTSGAEIQK